LKLTLLVGVLEGEGGGGAILPRLRAKVVVEAGARGHGLGVEVRGERAILHTRNTRNRKRMCTQNEQQRRPPSSLWNSSCTPLENKPYTTVPTTTVGRTVGC